MLEFVGADQDALVFTGENGGLLRNGNFGRALKWAEAVGKAGLPAGFHSMTSGTPVTPWRPRPARRRICAC